MNTRPFYFGLIFIAIIAILANYLGNTDFSHHYHISALIIAICERHASSHWHCAVWFSPHFWRYC